MSKMENLVESTSKFVDELHIFVTKTQLELTDAYNSK